MSFFSLLYSLSYSKSNRVIVQYVYNVVFGPITYKNTMYV